VNERIVTLDTEEWGYCGNVHKRTAMELVEFCAYVCREEPNASGTSDAPGENIARGRDLLERNWAKVALRRC